MLDEYSYRFEVVKPWIREALSKESRRVTGNTFFRTQLNSEIQMAICHPRDSKSVCFPSIDHLILPISDGDVTVFALFNPGTNVNRTIEKWLASRLVLIYEYQVSVMDVEVDVNSIATTSRARAIEYASNHQLIFLINKYDMKHLVNNIHKTSWYMDVSECRRDANAIISQEIRKRNYIGLYAMLKEDKRLDRITESNAIQNIEFKIDRRESTVLKNVNEQKELEKSESLSPIHEETDLMESESQSDGLVEKEFTELIVVDDNIDKIVNCVGHEVINGSLDKYEDETPNTMIKPPSTVSCTSTVSGDVDSNIVLETPIHLMPGSSNVNGDKTSINVAEKKFKCFICNKFGSVKTKLPQIIPDKYVQRKERRRQRQISQPDSSTSGRCLLCEMDAKDSVLCDENKCIKCRREVPSHQVPCRHKSTKLGVLFSALPENEARQLKLGIDTLMSGTKPKRQSKKEVSCLKQNSKNTNS